MARILERKNDEAEDKGYDLNDRGSYRDVDKEHILVHWSRAGKKDLGGGMGRACLSTYCTPPR